MRNAATYFFSLVLTVVVPLACNGSSDEHTTACAPGRSVDCTGTAGCQGYQVCKEDGSGYGDCVCARPDAGSFPSTGPQSGKVGATCTSDNDCRNGMFCLRSDSRDIGGEGPSSGLCTAPCASDHTVCDKWDDNAKCVVFADGASADDPKDDTAFCLPRCVLGDSGGAEKCLGRSDLACAEAVAASGKGYCRPVCRTNVDCEGRACNLRTGLCTDGAPSGAPIGTSCDPANSGCAGGCFAHNAYAECSGFCRLGSADCGQNLSAGPPYAFFCHLDPGPISGPGDLGFCAKLCDCDGDCGRADAVCEPVSGLAAKAGHAGVCGSVTLATGTKRPNLPCMR